MSRLRVFKIIDPQNSFIEGGSLAVSGGKSALDNTVTHLKKYGNDYDLIPVSLDTHNPTNLGFPENWEGPESINLKPGEPFPIDKISPDRLWPKTKYTAERDVNFILKQPGFMCWPSHCQKGTDGWKIYQPLEEVLDSLGSKVIYLTKGEDDARDNYSLYHFGDGELTNLGKNFNLWDPENDNPEIFVSGLAMDFCVFETISSLQRICKKGRYNLMLTMTASIRDPNYVECLYNTLKNPVNFIA